jgi:hypothetical protein
MLHSGIYPASCLLEFDLVLEDDCIPIPRPNDRFIVLISPDGGATWSSANILREWNDIGSPYIFEDISRTTGDHVQIPFTSTSETFKIAFYIEKTNNFFCWYKILIDNVRITRINSAIQDSIPIMGVISPNQSLCFNATQTITISNFTVEAPGGDAEFIAGQKVTMLPGTVVQHSAHMLARIALNNEFCQPQNKLAAASVSGSRNPEPSSGDNQFKIFPNPSSGKFTLRIDQVAETESVTLYLYNIKGELLLSTTFTGKKEQEFNLTDFPDGLYVARIITGSKTKVIKLIVNH